MRFSRVYLYFVFLLASFLCGVAFASEQEQLIDAGALEYNGMRGGGGVSGRERVIDAGALEYNGMRGGGGVSGRERVIDAGALEYNGMRGGGGASGRERVIDAGALEYTGQRIIQNDAKATPAINQAGGTDLNTKKRKGVKATNDVVREIKLIKIAPRSGFIPFKPQDIRTAFDGARQNASPPVPPSQDITTRKVPEPPKKDDAVKQIQEWRIEKRNRPEASPTAEPDGGFTPQSYGTPSQGKP